MSSWKQAWIAVEVATVRECLVQVAIVRYEQKEERDDFCMTFHPGFETTPQELEPLGLDVDRVSMAPNFSTWFPFFMGLFRTWGEVWVMHDSKRVLSSLTRARKALPHAGLHLVRKEDMPIPRQIVELAQAENKVSEHLAVCQDLGTMALRWGVVAQSPSKIVRRTRTIGGIFAQMLPRLPNDAVELNRDGKTELQDETNVCACSAG